MAIGDFVALNCGFYLGFGNILSRNSCGEVEGMKYLKFWKYLEMNVRGQDIPTN